MVCAVELFISKMSDVRFIHGRFDTNWLYQWPSTSDRQFNLSLWQGNPVSASASRKRWTQLHSCFIIQKLVNLQWLVDSRWAWIAVPGTVCCSSPFLRAFENSTALVFGAFRTRNVCFYLSSETAKKKQKENGEKKHQKTHSHTRALADFI